jgi:hypothetical protein
MRRLCLALLLPALAACHRSTTASAAGDGSSAPVTAPSESGGESSSASGATAASTELVKKICATATCAGPMARVTVFRDKTGAVRSLELDGDIRRCSHPPTLFFDASGNQVDAIPMKPVVPGSDEAKHFAAIRERHTRGLDGRETCFCPEPG